MGDSVPPEGLRLQENHAGKSYRGYGMIQHKRRHSDLQSVRLIMSVEDKTQIIDLTVRQDTLRAGAPRSMGPQLAIAAF